MFSLMYFAGKTPPDSEALSPNLGRFESPLRPLCPIGSLAACDWDCPLVTERCVCLPVEEAGTHRKVSDKEFYRLSAEICKASNQLDLTQPDLNGGFYTKSKLLYILPGTG